MSPDDLTEGQIQTYLSSEDYFPIMPEISQQVNYYMSPLTLTTSYGAVQTSYSFARGHDIQEHRTADNGFIHITFRLANSSKHGREIRYNIFSWLAEVGGISSITYKFLYLVVGVITRHIFMNEVINALFLQRKKPKEAPLVRKQQTDFSN